MNKNMTKIFHTLILVCTATGLFSLASCKKLDSYLDKAESGGITEEQLFNDYVQAQGLLSNTYATAIGAGDWMPSYGFTYAAATDEAKCPYNFATGPITLNNGSLTPTTNPVDVWNNMYQSIRKTNRFLQRIDQVPAAAEEQIKGKPRMKGEAYFLRAWCYAELYKRYGTVPIVKRVLTLSDNLNIPRSSQEEMIDFIVSDCDSAALLLPVRYEANNLGRATKGAAMTLKSRILLYAASALHNPTNEQNKWKKAADAAQDVMSLNSYSLDNNYKTLFHTRTSTEIIFQSTINQVWQVVANDWVRHTQPPSQGGGWGNLQPLQNLVDDYEMTDGSKFDWNNPVHAANPYSNRDPRFHQTVIYNDRTWAGSVIKSFVGSGTVDALNYNTAATQTGYYAAKLLDENSTLISSYRPGSHFWVFMRYAEVLLNYAEARNEELTQPDQSIYDAVNAIRSRQNVQMPALPAGLNKDQMRERIRHERRIELAFETHRFWDVRRWRIGEQVFKTAWGMRITRNTNATYKYERFITENRIYRPAFDLFPIPQTEIERNKALAQNPGY